MSFFVVFCQNERATLEQEKAEDEVLRLAGEQQVCIIFIISYGLSLPLSCLWFVEICGGVSNRGIWELVPYSSKQKSLW